MLPNLRDGEAASMSDAKVEAKETRPPPRYNEGTLIDAMQNALRTPSTGSAASTK